MQEPLSLKVLRKLFYTRNGFTSRFVQFSDQQANDYLYNRIKDALNKKEGLFITKFGTVELLNLCTFIANERGLTLKDYFYHIRGIKHLDERKCFSELCMNAGFFPQDISLAKKWKDIVVQDIPTIDILASYIKLEAYLHKTLAHCTKVNLNGFYAPFMWKNPWTRILGGGKILVIHPFTHSIRAQYENNREKLFLDPAVLPRFASLETITAVQSIAGTATDFATWFDALEYMERQIDTKDFDIALIGCGAYGMQLGAYIKRKGKIAIQLSGWTQMLFGIYGNRWIEDQPYYARFVNEYWIRPSAQEIPANFKQVENGCYW